jgi:SAM-dependent MidA family methyltransferase
VRPATVNVDMPLSRELASRIAERGPITFAEYMEACLYDPEHGYYSLARNHRSADYFTSVDAHPIFGRLIARRLAQMWRQLSRPARFLVVEAGAGAGRLAVQILDFAQANLPEFYAAVEYIAIDRSRARRAEQEVLLRAHMEEGRARSSAELPAKIPAGCLLSNELFDAMPVHRVIRRDLELREIYVTVKDDRFTDETGPLSTPRVAEYFSRQGIALQERQRAEAGLAGCDWISDAARRLERGFALTIDYGYEARELYGPHRMNGTLLAYREHRVSEDFYSPPGEQDLTSHANFTALKMWGADGGLEFVSLEPQSKFLLELGRENEFADLYDAGQSEIEKLRAQNALSQLIHPEGMGLTFQVLTQKKNI